MCLKVNMYFELFFILIKKNNLNNNIKCNFNLSENRIIKEFK